jgi:hypothetical protein
MAELGAAIGLKPSINSRRDFRNARVTFGLQRHNMVEEP